MTLDHSTGRFTPTLTFWLPLGLAFALAIAELVVPSQHMNIVYIENGILEICQPLIAFMGVWIGLRTLLTCPSPIWVKVWLGTAVLGLLYIGLEEISYGQQLLKWETGDYWAEINDQNETNLHNTSSWLDQKPRALLLVGIIVGGLVFPLLRRVKPALLPQKFALVYPSTDLVWVAGLALFSQLTKVLQKTAGISIYDRPSELNEFYMIAFVTLYLWQLGWQIRNNRVLAA